MKPIVPPEIEEYAARHSAPASEVRDAIEVYTRAHCQDPQMLTGSLEAALLQMLIRLTNARRVLEIGLFTGYSALAMAEALPDHGALWSCEINPEHAAIARAFFDKSPHGRKITILEGDARALIPRLEGPFDFVYLDADKEAYPEYYEAIVPLLRPGGVLAADNVLWSRRVLDPKQPSDKALASFNARVATDERVDCVLLTVRDGVMVARRR